MVVHTFADIEAKRERLGVIQRDLCQAADVHEGTYTKAKRGDKDPTPRIRRKLWAALEKIGAARGVVMVEALERPADAGQNGETVLSGEGLRSTPIEGDAEVRDAAE